MTTIENIRQLVEAVGRPDLPAGFALTIGDCAELLQEIERMRTLAELDLEGEQWVRSVFAGQANAFEKERDAYRKALLEANRRRRSVRESCARICDERAKRHGDACYFACSIEAEACAAAIRAGWKS